MPYVGSPQQEIDVLRAEVESLNELNARLSDHIKAKTGDTVDDELYDRLWQEVYPGKPNDWEYPAQVHRHVVNELDDRAKEITRLRKALKEAGRQAVEEIGNKHTTVGSGASKACSALFAHCYNVLAEKP